MVSRRKDILVMSCDLRCNHERNLERDNSRTDSFIITIMTAGRSSIKPATNPIHELSNAYM